MTQKADDDMAEAMTGKRDERQAAPRPDDSGTAGNEAARLRRIIDRASEEIHILNADTLTFLEMNRAARQNLGYTAEEIRGMTPCDIVPNISAHELETALAPLFCGDQDEVVLESEQRRKDGSLCPITVRLELDDSTEPRLLIAYITDQSDTIALLAQIRLADDTSEFHFTKWHLDTGRIIRNPGVDRIYGFESHDPKRTMADFRALVASEDLHSNVTAFEALARSEDQIFDRTFRVIRPDGELRWIRAVGQRSSHNPNIVVGLQCDVTESVLAERARQTARKELDSLLRYLPDFISCARPDTTLTFVNEPYAQFLDNTPEQLVGRKFLEFVPEQHRAELRTALAGLSPDSPMITTQERDFLPDGTIHCLLWTNLMVFDGDTPVELISVGRDISEQDNARRTIEAQADDLQRSNEALRVSDERFQLAVRGASVGIWDWPLDGDGHQFWSDKLYELLGLEPGAVPPHIDSFTALVHPDDLDDTMADLERHLATGEKYEHAFRMRHASGEYRWFIDTGEASHDADGRPVRMVGTMMDIHDRKMAEAELREREARFRSLYNDTPVMLHSVDARGLIISVSDYWLDRMGYEREDVLGRPPTDFMTRESRRRVTETELARFFATGMSREVPLQFVRRDGRVMDVLLSAVAIHDESGSIERSLAVVIDVTEKKRIEDQLARQQRELELIFDNVPVRIWYKDDENRVLRLNKRAAEAIGQPANEIEGHLVTEWAPPEVAERFHREDLAVIRSGQPMLGIIEQRTTRDGRVEWMRTDKVPYTDPETGRTLLLATSTDITALKTAELTMAAQAKALQRSNEELEQFAYIASHDLKAPLRGIDNLASWIEEDLADKMDEESRSNMQLLRGRVARLEQLLSSLLHYSRIGRSKTEVTEVDLGGLATEVFDLVRGAQAFTLACDAMPVLVTGMVPLELVLRNLFSNAIKHHDQGEGTITLSASDEGDRFHITVADDGPGIEPAFHRQIFGMFQVLKPRDQMEASGLGLAMIEKQLRALDCRIWVESDPAAQRGTTFHFTWPKTWPYGATADDAPAAVAAE